MGSIVSCTVTAQVPPTPLQKELELARNDGIPTSAAEFRATIKVPAEADNAAPFYRQLPPTGPRPDISNFQWRLIWDPSPEAVNDVQTALKQYQKWFDFSDQIVMRPSFWVDRKWEEGMGALQPELAQGRGLAQVLLLRGSLKARQGDAAGAVSDARGASQIASHFGSEPTLISNLVGDSITQIVLYKVAEWTFRYRDVPQYPELLSQTLKAWEQPDLRAEVSADLYQGLLLMDQVQTKEGRALVGLTEDDRAPGDAYMAEVMNQPVEAGKLRFAKGFRQYWKALRPFNQERATEARFEMTSGMLSVPTAVKLIESLFGDNYVESERLKSYDARRVFYAVFLKAAREEFPAKLDTSRFISPIDGKPVRYSYDGNELIIQAGVMKEREVRLVIPPIRPNMN